MRWRWHTLLFAVYPVIFLFARNSGNLPTNALTRPLMAAVILAVMAWLTARMTTRDASRGALLATSWVILWSTYGHLHRVLVELSGVPAMLGQHRILLTLWVAGMTVLAVALRRGYPGPNKTHDLERFTTLAGVVLLGLALITSGAGFTRESPLPLRPESQKHADVAHKDMDVYHIILDGYPRADTLHDLYDFDNEPFLKALRQRGFCIADSARSNYMQTLLSVTSTLEGQYISPSQYGLDSGSTDRRPLVRTLSQLMQVGGPPGTLLASQSQWIRTFATGYTATELLDVDQYQSPLISLNEFERALAAATPLDVLFNLVESRYGDVLHRGRIEFTFEHLPVAVDAPPNAFTFAHIVAPHPPFVFAPVAATAGVMVPLADGDHVVGDGGISLAQYRAAFCAQVEAVNERLLTALDVILASDRKSAILLHGDHGPGSLLRWEDRIPEPAAARERLGILLALRLPGESGHACYPDMTPVNAARILSRHVNGSAVELLPDRSFFSSWSHPYDFVEMASDGKIMN